MAYYDQKKKALNIFEFLKQNIFFNKNQKIFLFSLFTEYIHNSPWNHIYLLISTAKKIGKWCIIRMEAKK